MEKIVKTASGILISVMVFSIVFTPKEVKASFSYSTPITIDHTKVPSDQTNFPILVSGTYTGVSVGPDLRTVANGGGVTDAEGDDIGFYSNSNCSTGKLDWEVETYTASTGVVNYWVEVPSLTSATDTVIYLCYGDSGITTDQSNATGTWDSNYKGVWHVPNGSSLTVLDSTGVNNGTVIGSVTAGTGKVDGGADFGSSTDGRRITTPYTGTPTNFTVSAWVYATAGTASSYHRIVDKSYTTGFWFGHNGGGSSTDWGGGIRNNDGNVLFLGVTMSLNTWHYLLMKRSGTTQSISLDGGASTNSATVSSTALDTTPLWVGTSSTMGVDTFKGIVDEIRFSDSARSANWITTEYNNQSSPSTFYAMGSRTFIGSPVKAINSLALASVKLFNGLTSARIKVINGL